jgi:exo-beta-1,3-glucanase (GH17 family)
MRVVACLVFTILFIAGAWAWLGTPVVMPEAPLREGERLHCLSYSPFRGGQTPLDTNVIVSTAQIESDLARLAQITECIRTYSVDYGQDKIAGIAAKLGLKVWQGAWLSSHPEKNRIQLETVIRLAKQYPNTIRAIVAGNEVLLRGEMSSTELAATIRTLKAQVNMPVTYADVWEFWLRNRDLGDAVDFITIHILPYWEDFPVSADNAAAHVETIRRRLVNSFPGKQVVIGETGWPSAGRMREGALPSPANQARVIQDVLTLAKRENFTVNVIEAYDEPWKRALEGSVGGNWGIIDDVSREFKFMWGRAVSNHPNWKLQALAGIAFAVVVFGAAFLARPKVVSLTSWLAVTGNALIGGVLIGWAIENVPIESLGIGGWLRSLALCAVASLSAPLFSIATVCGIPAPRLSQIIGPIKSQATHPVPLSIGIIVIATMLLTIEVALGFVFDPRYKDFPFAPLTAAAVPFLTHSFAVSPSSGERGVAELTAASLLSLCVFYILPNEGLANWQSLWLCVAFIAFAIGLTRVRDVPN